MSLDPGAAQVAIDEGADRLEKAADALYDATVKAGNAELEFQRARLMFLAGLHRKMDRLPAQDIRDALVKEAVGEVWDAFYIAKYEQEAIEKRYRALAASVNARQSLLRARGA